MLISSHSERTKRTMDNQSQALRFIRDVTYTTPKNLSLKMGLGLSAVYKLLNRLVNAGYVRKHYVEQMKQFLFGLTEVGILMSWTEDERIEARNAFQPSKVNPSFVLHELQLQKAMILAQQAGFRSWLPGHLIKEKLAKRPDAIVTNPSGAVLACEYEAHSKSIKRIQMIVSIYLQEIKRGRYDYVVYIAPDCNLASRLQRLFKSITSVPVNGVSVPLSEKHYMKFKFYSLQGWPSTEISNESA